MAVTTRADRTRNMDDARWKDYERTMRDIYEYSQRTGDQEPVRKLTVMLEYTMKRLEAGKPPLTRAMLKKIIAKRPAKTRTTKP